MDWRLIGGMLAFAIWAISFYFGARAAIQATARAHHARTSRAHLAAEERSRLDGAATLLGLPPVLGEEIGHLRHRVAVASRSALYRSSARPTDGPCGECLEDDCVCGERVWGFPVRGRAVSGAGGWTMPLVAYTRGEAELRRTQLAGAGFECGPVARLLETSIAGPVT
jgi:hypothetical protein